MPLEDMEIISAILTAPAIIIAPGKIYGMAMTLPPFDPLL
jgi:hypothetical protein